MWSDALLGGGNESLEHDQSHDDVGCSFLLCAAGYKRCLAIVALRLPLVTEHGEHATDNAIFLWSLPPPLVHPRPTSQLYSFRHAPPSTKSAPALGLARSASSRTSTSPRDEGGGEGDEGGGKGDGQGDGLL